MAISLCPLSPHVGVELTGIDPRVPLTDKEKNEFIAAFETYHLVLIRGVEVTETEQVRLCETLGRATSRGGRGYAKPGRQSTLVSNRHEEGIYRDGELFFHSDLSYMEHPLKGRSLHALLVPSEGGDTLFANVGAAYDALPEETKQRIAGLQVRHAVKYKVNGIPFVDDFVRPLAEPHPRTGRVGLTAGRAVAREIVGIERPESRSLLEDLWAHIEDPRIGYRHQWKPHDFIFWDNIALQHARTNFDPNQGRVLRAVSIDEPERAVSID